MQSRNALLMISNRKHVRIQKTDSQLAKEVKEEFLKKNLEDTYAGNKPGLKATSSFKLVLEAHNDAAFHDIPRSIRLYFKAGDWAISVTRGKYEALFNAFMFAVILTAGINEGIRTYASFANNPAMSAIDDVVFSTFASEFLLKVVAEKSKPLYYFVGKDGMWNTFDFLILVFCVPGIGNFRGKSASVLRLIVKIFRLFRVAKLLRAIPALNVIMMGLMGGIESIVYIGLLMFLFIYVYAVVGVLLFAKTDPFFFRSMPIALMTLFHALTFDNWDTNFYVTAYGCDMFNGGIYVSPGNMTDGEWQSVPAMYRCSEPQPLMGLAAVYWISYIAITALILVSLFIGVITVSMQASMAAVRMEAEEATRKKLLAQQLHELEEMKLRHYTMSMVSASSKENDLQSPGTDSSLYFVSRFASFVPSAVRKRLWFRHTSRSLNYEEKVEKINEMRRLLKQAFHGGEHLLDKEDRQPGHRRRQLFRELAISMRALIASTYFQYFMVGFVLLASIMVGIEIQYANQYPGYMSNVFYACEWVVFSGFASEVFIRFAAEEMDLVEYFKNKWNFFDVLITVLTIPPISISFVSMFRICRLLRVVKLVESLPQLGIIVNSLGVAGASIGYIFTMILMIIYVYGLIGVNLFGMNDPSNFGTLDVAMRNLVDVATLDNWGLILYTNIYGCDVFPISSMCNSPHAQHGSAVLYFVSFILLTTFIMFTLFIGVVTTGLEEATKHHYCQSDLDARLKALSVDKKLDKRVIELYRRVFSMLDWDGSGTIEAEELQIGLSSVGIRPGAEELLRWIREVDANFNGVFDLAEFVTFMIMMHKRNVKNKFVNSVHRVSQQLAQERLHSVHRRHSSMSSGEGRGNGRHGGGSGAGEQGGGFLDPLRRTFSTKFFTDDQQPLRRTFSSKFFGGKDRTIHPQHLSGEEENESQGESQSNGRNGMGSGILAPFRRTLSTNLFGTSNQPSTESSGLRNLKETTAKRATMAINFVRALNKNTSVDDVEDGEVAEKLKSGDQCDSEGNGRDGRAAPLRRTLSTTLFNASDQPIPESSGLRSLKGNNVKKATLAINFITAISKVFVDDGEEDEVVDKGEQQEGLGDYCDDRREQQQQLRVDELSGDKEVTQDDEPGGTVARRSSSSSTSDKNHFIIDGAGLIEHRMSMELVAQVIRRVAQQSGASAARAAWSPHAEVQDNAKRQGGREINDGRENLSDEEKDTELGDIARRLVNGSKLEEELIESVKQVSDVESYPSQAGVAIAVVESSGEAAAGNRSKILASLLCGSSDQNSDDLTGVAAAEAERLKKPWNQRYRLLPHTMDMSLAASSPTYHLSGRESPSGLMDMDTTSGTVGGLSEGTHHSDAVNMIYNRRNESLPEANGKLTDVEAQQRPDRPWLHKFKPSGFHPLRSRAYLSSPEKKSTAVAPGVATGGGATAAGVGSPSSATSVGPESQRLLAPASGAGVGTETGARTGTASGAGAGTGAAQPLVVSQSKWPPKSAARRSPQRRYEPLGFHISDNSTNPDERDQIVDNWMYGRR